MYHNDKIIDSVDHILHQYNSDNSYVIHLHIQWEEYLLVSEDTSSPLPFSLPHLLCLSSSHLFFSPLSRLSPYMTLCLFMFSEER
jgi:hypothetical protein